MTFNKFAILFTIIECMKKLNKSLLLLTLSSLLLTACSWEKKSFCLETSTSPDFVSGKCAVASPTDINQTIYVYCSEMAEDKSNFLISWNDVIYLKYFSFSGGLEGKKVDSAIYIAKNTLKVEFHGLCRDEKATGGYFKVSNLAFTGHTEKTKDATLYAYIAISNELGDIDKPADYIF